MGVKHRCAQQLQRADTAAPISNQESYTGRRAHNTTKPLAPDHRPGGRKVVTGKAGERKQQVAPSRQGSCFILSKRVPVAKTPSPAEPWEHLQRRNEATAAGASHSRPTSYQPGRTSKLATTSYSHPQDLELPSSIRVPYALSEAHCGTRVWRAASPLS